MEGVGGVSGAELPGSGGVGGLFEGVSALFGQARAFAAAGGPSSPPPPSPTRPVVFPPADVKILNSLNDTLLRLKVVQAAK